MSGRERALGIGLGVILGLALIVLFVFFLGDVIDPSTVGE